MLRMAGAARDGIVGTAPRPSLVSLAGSDLKSSSSSSWHGRLRKERTSSTGSNSWHAGIGIDLGASAGSSVSDPLDLAGVADGIESKRSSSNSTELAGVAGNGTAVDVGAEVPPPQPLPKDEPNAYTN